MSASNLAQGGMTQAQCAVDSVRWAVFGEMAGKVSDRRCAASLRLAGRLQIYLSTRLRSNIRGIHRQHGKGNNEKEGKYLLHNKSWRGKPTGNLRRQFQHHLTWAIRCLRIKVKVKLCTKSLEKT
jgi:hypothetical protein